MNVRKLAEDLDYTYRTALNKLYSLYKMLEERTAVQQDYEKKIQEIRSEQSEAMRGVGGEYADIDEAERTGLEDIVRKGITESQSQQARVKELIFRLKEIPATESGGHIQYKAFFEEIIEKGMMAEEEAKKIREETRSPKVTTEHPPEIEVFRTSLKYASIGTRADLMAWFNSLKDWAVDIWNSITRTGEAIDNIESVISEMEQEPVTAGEEGTDLPEDSTLLEVEGIKGTPYEGTKGCIASDFGNGFVDVEWEIPPDYQIRKDAVDKDLLRKVGEFEIYVYESPEDWEESNGSGYMKVMDYSTAVEEAKDHLMEDTSLSGVRIFDDSGMLIEEIPREDVGKQSSKKTAEDETSDAWQLGYDAAQVWAEEYAGQYEGHLPGEANMGEVAYEDFEHTVESGLITPDDETTYMGGWFDRWNTYEEEFGSKNASKKTAVDKDLLKVVKKSGYDYEQLVINEMMDANMNGGLSPDEVVEFADSVRVEITPEQAQSISEKIQDGLPESKGGVRTIKDVPIDEGDRGYKPVYLLGREVGSNENTFAIAGGKEVYMSHSIDDVRYVFSQLLEEYKDLTEDDWFHFLQGYADGFGETRAYKNPLAEYTAGGSGLPSYASKNTAKESTKRSVKKQACSLCNTPIRKQASECLICGTVVKRADLQGLIENYLDRGWSSDEIIAKLSETVTEPLSYYGIEGYDTLEELIDAVEGEQFGEQLSGYMDQAGGIKSMKKKAKTSRDIGLGTPPEDPLAEEKTHANNMEDEIEKAREDKEKLAGFYPLQRGMTVLCKSDKQIYQVDDVYDDRGLIVASGLYAGFHGKKILFIDDVEVWEGSRLRLASKDIVLPEVNKKVGVVFELQDGFIIREATVLSSDVDDTIVDVNDKVYDFPTESVYIFGEGVSLEKGIKLAEIPQYDFDQADPVFELEDNILTVTEF